jgi:hypothetical protein
MFLARAGALCLSVGIVATLMVRAGGLGCSSPGDTTADSTTIVADPPSGSGATTASSSEATVRYTIGFPGTKASPFPNVADDILSSKPRTTSPSPKPSSPPPEFFPGTKAPAGGALQRQEAPQPNAQ